MLLRFGTGNIIVDKNKDLLSWSCHSNEEWLETDLSKTYSMSDANEYCGINESKG